MRSTLVLCVVLACVVAAVCGEPSQDQRRLPFPGPSELKDDPAFGVLVDAYSISGDPLVVLGVQTTFGELRQELAPRLEAYGWKVTPADAQALPEDNVLNAEKDGMCILFWNMSPGSWAPGMKTEAIRENPNFEGQASQYVTVFSVWVSDCA